MIRVCKLTGKWYGCEFSDLKMERDNIKAFVEEGTPVIIVNDLSDVDELFDERPEVIMAA